MFRFLLSKLFTKREKMKGDDVKPFLDHLEDLRGTLFKMALTLVVAVGVCFIWNQELFSFLQRPLLVNGLNPNDVLVSHDVIGPFMASLSVSFYAGLVVAFPILIYFLGEFVLPAMTDKEKKYATPAIVIGFILFIAGAWFCFYQIVPTMVKFLSDWGLARGIKTQYAVMNYFKLVTLMSLVFGLLCQIPVVMVSLHAVGIVTYEWIRSTRMYAYAGILVLCGVVSPAPDIPSLVMITLPIMALYEICIWVIYFLEKRKPAEPEKEKPSVAPLAVTPYADAQPAQTPQEYHDDPYHHDDHYNDGHYHDEHYHREHSDYYHEPSPEVKSDEPKPSEPEPKPDDAPKTVEPPEKNDGKPSEDNKP
jgi:sec-independent protein translocase protein TatC